MLRDLLQRLFGGEAAEPGLRLRPPGAAPEPELHARCIRCARCLEACPWGAIRLAPLSSGRLYGTPLVDPLQAACHLCMRCPQVCPTGALRPLAREDVRMGTAEVDTSRCLSWNGTVCNLCHTGCPLQGTAITLDPLLRPVISPSACTGCGVCYQGCPAEPERAIRVRPARAL